MKHCQSDFAPYLWYGGRSVPSERQNDVVSELMVFTVEGTVHCNYCGDPPSSAFLLRKVDTIIRILAQMAILGSKCHFLAFLIIGPYRPLYHHARS